MSDLPEGRPQFASAMRGYDRDQVDIYVEEVLTLLDASEERARVAESQVESGPHATVGPRVTQIFELATAEAAELRDRIRAEADEQLADATRRTAELVAAAEREAEDVMLRVRAQGEEARAEQERERELMRRQVEALEARKNHLIDELRRLQAALASAADSVAGHDEPPAWNDEGETQTMEQAPSPPLADPGAPPEPR
jgi:hypothetical protein